MTGLKVAAYGPHLEGLLGNSQERHLHHPVAGSSPLWQAVHEALHQFLHDGQMHQQVRRWQAAQTRLGTQLLRLLWKNGNICGGVSEAAWG